jgi:hypothetical protein
MIRFRRADPPEVKSLRAEDGGRSFLFAPWKHPRFGSDLSHPDPSREAHVTRSLFLLFARGSPRRLFIHRLFFEQSAGPSRYGPLPRGRPSRPKVDNSLPPKNLVSLPPIPINSCTEIFRRAVRTSWQQVKVRQVRCGHAHGTRPADRIEYPD